jgi:cyclic pyranopterin phosphate synthase
MVDITGKPESYRKARASGKIWLKRRSLEAIKKEEVKKGDVFEASRLAAIMAVKRTSEAIPLCHPIPITGIDVEFKLGEDHIKVEVEVRTRAQTGVEMEALYGVSMALLNIWDMVKYLEKDEAGSYPFTCIGDIRVLSKVKIEDEPDR